MARVKRKKGSQGAQNHGSPVQKRRKLHTQKHKHNFLPRPPPGYTFVPVGNVFISRNCRVESEKAGKRCREILEKPKRGKKVGLFVSTEIYERVKAAEASTRATRAQRVQQVDERINTNARETVQKVFPKMPIGCVEHTVRHAYAKKSGRTGRAGDLSPEQRARNAVRAHARHCHTRYEAMLYGGSVDRQKARQVVDSEVRGILNAWEGKTAAKDGIKECKPR